MATSESPRTVISSDGLRYRHKTAGVQFVGGTFGGTMSCLRCGMHRPRSMLASKKIAGHVSLVCAPSCAVVNVQLEAVARGG